MTTANRSIRRVICVWAVLEMGFGTGLASGQTREVDTASVQFKTLYSFSGTDGAQPLGISVQAMSGDLYGTTEYGGVHGPLYGTIFNITVGGTFTMAYSFCSLNNCPDGAYPTAGLVQAINGDFYGTALEGGAEGYGTVFKIPNGTSTTLYSFCSQANCVDGKYPQLGLIRASNGDFYGTTSEGGASSAGTIFKITPNGIFTTLYSFCSQADCTDGSWPDALVQATDGSLYGTTQYGGTNNVGTLFKIANGTLSTLYNFCSQSGCADGKYPGQLLQSASGNLYGFTTAGGGSNAAGIGAGAGTIFQITPEGTLTTLYHFCSESGCADGNVPNGLLQATDGNFYGTTIGGGINGKGTVFEITPIGTLATLYSFCSQSDCTDGLVPNGLVQATNGVFYGTTLYGGHGGPIGFCDSGDGCGTIFSLSAGLGPFVETRPTIGLVGETVTIVGYGLEDATSVTFNGTPATILLDDATVIFAKVPAGATSGKIQVVTPSGTLTSDVAFEVVHIEPMRVRKWR